MANPGRTQKQIAERYKGNLGYYNKLHPWRRARLLVSLLTIAGGLLFIWLFQRHGHEEFFNTGPLSAGHARLVDKCESCHGPSVTADGRLTRAQLTAVLRQRFHKGMPFEEIDRKCEVCHKQHAFHEANVVENRSCSACHQEHQGSTLMKAVASSQCISCHGNSQVMQASAQKGEQLEPAAFHRHPHPPQQVVFELPRPPRGYTQVFRSFSADHPEFQLNAEKARDPKVRDPDTLRFNHQRHFAADVPPINKDGTKLDCNYCHKSDTEGRLMKRISFAANCQPCHSLQFDVNNPDLPLPHGSSTAVLGFLRALPTHYEELARSRGMDPGQIRSFVEQQRRQLRNQYGSDEQLIHAVFFTTDPYKPPPGAPSPTRASFAGCRFCHEVKPAAVGAPIITKPILVDRWISRSNFNHTRHASLKCDDCHHASQSRETSDILMPLKARCVTCHSPAGKVSDACIVCHRYHAPGQASTVGTQGAAPVSARQMLLGQK